MGSQVQHRGGAAQNKPENTTAREFNGQPSPAPRQSCPKQAEKHHREEVIGQPSPAPRQSCPKQAGRHHRGEGSRPLTAFKMEKITIL